MLAPLFLAWLLSIGAIYLITASLANAPFDTTLENNLRVLAQQIRIQNEQIKLALPQAAIDLLHADHTHPTYFQVRRSNGEQIDGDPELPSPLAEDMPAPGQVLFRNARVGKLEMRIAAMALPVSLQDESNPQNWLLLQIGETLDKRSELSQEIIKGVVLPQFVIVPISIVLVWFGLYRGIRTLARLQERILARAPDDMRPINPNEAPAEVTPLVDSFNQILARLERNIQNQRRFIADAAHQMRTPLAGLRTQAELALRQTETTEIHRSLQQLATSSERATHLLNQLLTLAHAERHGESSSDARDSFAPIDLESLARDLLRDWVPVALGRQIDLGYEASDTAVPISGNEFLLRELLNNLIDNALHYTPKGGIVTVRISADHAPQSGQAVAVMEVEDNGPGIPESEREQVFERFYRLSSHATDGSGLGLSIVREIALQHQARLVLDRNPRCTDTDNPGLSVRVIFPLLAQQQDLQYKGDV